MSKQQIMAKRASKIIKEQLGADFIIAPLNRSMDWSHFKGSEENLRKAIYQKYGRQVEIVN